jgi:hypothetical protein
MNIDLEVQVLPELGHRDRSEPQSRNREVTLKEAGSESTSRRTETGYRGVTVQGKRACTREALVTKGRERRSGGCVEKADVLTWGDLA